MQLSQKVLSANLTEISELHEFSESNMLLDLQNYCFEGEIRNLQPKQISKVFREGRRAEYYNKLKFDLCFLELDEANCGLRRKKMANVLEEKENL